GQSDVKTAAAAVQLDVETAHHHHLGGADDIGELRVDFRAEVLEVHRQHWRPRVLDVAERLIQDQADHPQFGGGKLPTFDLGRVAAVPPEEVVHQNEHELRVHHE